MTDDARPDVVTEAWGRRFNTVVDYEVGTAGRLPERRQFTMTSQAMSATEQQMMLDRDLTDNHEVKAMPAVYCDFVNGSIMIRDLPELFPADTPVDVSRRAYPLRRDMFKHKRPLHVATVLGHAIRAERHGTLPAAKEEDCDFKRLIGRYLSTTCTPVVATIKANQFTHSGGMTTWGKLCTALGRLQQLSLPHKRTVVYFTGFNQKDMSLALLQRIQRVAQVYLEYDLRSVYRCRNWDGDSSVLAAVTNKSLRDEDRVPKMKCDNYAVLQGNNCGMPSAGGRRYTQRKLQNDNSPSFRTLTMYNPARLDGQGLITGSMTPPSSPLTAATLDSSAKVMLALIDRTLTSVRGEQLPAQQAQDAHGRGFEHRLGETVFEGRFDRVDVAVAVLQMHRATQQVLESTEWGVTNVEDTLYSMKRLVRLAKDNIGYSTHEQANFKHNTAWAMMIRAVGIYSHWSKVMQRLPLLLGADGMHYNPLKDPWPESPPLPRVKMPLFSAGVSLNDH